MHGSFSPAIARQCHTDRALKRSIDELGGAAGLLVMHDQRAWSSVTFSGARHRFTWEFRGDEAIRSGEDLITFLPEHEFSIPGHLVADAAITHVHHSVADEPQLRVDFEILLLEEG